MRSLEALRMAFEAIRAHKLRGFFTVLGTVFGVTFLIAVITLIEGMNQYTIYLDGVEVGDDEIIGEAHAGTMALFGLHDGPITPGAPMRWLAQHGGIESCIVEPARDDAYSRVVPYVAVLARDRTVALRRRVDVVRHGGGGVV